MSDVCPSSQNFFSREENAVIIAIAKANHEGHSSTVYCLEVIGDFRNGDCHVFGEPFRLHNQLGRYIWCNQQLRNDRLKVGSIVVYSGSVNNRYSRNTEEQMVSCEVCSYVALFTTELTLAMR